MARISRKAIDGINAFIDPKATITLPDGNSFEAGLESVTTGFIPTFTKGKISELPYRNDLWPSKFFKELRRPNVPKELRSSRQSRHSPYDRAWPT